MSSHENPDESQDLEISFDCESRSEITDNLVTKSELQLKLNEMTQKMDVMLERMTTLFAQNKNISPSGAEAQSSVEIEAMRQQETVPDGNTVSISGIRLSDFTASASASENNSSVNEPTSYDVPRANNVSDFDTNIALGRNANLTGNFQSNNQGVTKNNGDDVFSCTGESFAGDNCDSNRKGMDAWSRLSTGMLQSMIPNTFNGEYGSAPVTYLKEMQRLIRLQNFTKHQFLLMANTTLTGRAAEWFLTVHSEIKSPNDFIMKFRNEYLSTEYIRGLKFKISHTKQLPGDSITDYLDRLAHLYSLFPDPVSDAEFIETALMGVDRESALQLSSAEYTTITALRSRSCKIDSLLRYKREPQKKREEKSEENRNGKWTNDRNAYNYHNNSRQNGGTTNGFGERRRDQQGSSVQGARPADRSANQSGTSSGTGRPAAARGNAPGENERSRDNRAAGKPSFRGGYKNNRPRPYNINDVRCYACSERGHYSSNCPKLNQGNGQASSSEAADSLGGERRQ